MTTITIEDLERQLELLAYAIYAKERNALHNWAHDYISLLNTIRGVDEIKEKVEQ